MSQDSSTVSLSSDLPRFVYKTSDTDTVVVGYYDRKGNLHLGMTPAKYRKVAKLTVKYKELDETKELYKAANDSLKTIRQRIKNLKKLNKDQQGAHDDAIKQLKAEMQTYIDQVAELKAKITKLYITIGIISAGAAAAVVVLIILLV